MIGKASMLHVLGALAVSVTLAACSSGSSSPTPTQAAASATPKSTASATAAATKAATTAPAATTTAAAGPGDEAGVTFAEFSLAGTSSVRAGKVTFKVSNSGMLPHNLNIVKSDLSIDKLPEKDGKVDLSGLQVLIKTADILEGGEDIKVDATFAPGKYIMFCNVVGHYDLGMRKQLTVN